MKDPRHVAVPLDMIVRDVATIQRVASAGNEQLAAEAEAAKREAARAHEDATREINGSLAPSTYQSNFSGGTMITREQAIQAAIDYLTRGLRRRLQITEGWPEGMPMAPWIPGNSLAREPKERLERVWGVYVPSDEHHVGSSHYLVIDQETGAVIADGWAGE